MKFRGKANNFLCALAGVPGHQCSEQRARWSSGFWSDVCQAAMDMFWKRLNGQTRDPWTGRKKEGTT